MFLCFCLCFCFCSCFVSILYSIVYVYHSTVMYCCLLLVLSFFSSLKRSRPRGIWSTSNMYLYYICSVVTLRNKISLRSVFLVLTGFHLIGFTFSNIYFEYKVFLKKNMKIVIIFLKFEVILVLFFQVLKFESVLLTLTVVGI